MLRYCHICFPNLLEQKGLGMIIYDVSVHVFWGQE